MEDIRRPRADSAAPGSTRWSDFTAEIAAGMRHLTPEERRRRAAFQARSSAKIRPVYPQGCARAAQKPGMPCSGGEKK